jgi:hypothetical protein
MGGLDMPDKPLKENSRRLWERVLSSIPHGLKVRTISVRGADKKTEKLPDRTEQPLEPPTPSPFGEE